MTDAETGEFGLLLLWVRKKMSRKLELEGAGNYGSTLAIFLTAWSF